MDRYGAKTRLNSGPRRSLFSPVGAFKPAMKFLEARDKDNKTDMDKWRPVVKGILTIAEEEEKEGGDDPNKDLDGLRNAKRKAAGRAAALRLFDCLWWDSPEQSGSESLQPLYTRLVVPSPLTSPLFHGSAGDF
ncbi:hypothetical protein BN1723_005343 [Verticillium longisporum]|uniref:Uncharacterized protein n=1 Tax=Verticillium longisporum TaxID=100787 RepID=A0A0G4N7T4_VERLO|nr:hypothetical protein BN1708_002355 [Verticillium longisporum]CRK42537.1 hypothetical protein BN1723_005343 [Verticillium longisporum]